MNRALVAGMIWAVVLASLGCVGGRQLHNRNWVEVSTPNFTILSCQRRSELIELARNLEIFRSVVEFTIGKKLPVSSVPTVVYAFDTPVTYRPFGDRHTGGFFLKTMRGNTIVIGGRHVTGIDPIIVIQHEYVHFLLSSHAGFIYPPWYHEGFAEFLGNTRILGNYVTIGSTPSDRIFDLKLGRMSVEELLGVSYGSEVRAGPFYARSWALVHYLNFGRDGQANTTAQLTRYFSAVNRGASEATAIQRAFGISIEQLDRDLDEYIDDFEFKAMNVGAENFGLGAEPEIRVPSKAEVATHLGELLLDRERLELAEHYFAQALELDPAAARAHSGIADARAAQNRNGEAEAAYAAALELDPADAQIHLQYANFLNGRAEAELDETSRAQLARKARSHYLKSWKLDDSIPETYAMYGSTYLLRGQDAALGAETLEHAHELLPSSPEINIRLARLKLATGHPEEARKLALATAIGFHDEEVERWVEEILTQSDGR